MQINILIPTTWNELSNEQFQKIVSLFHSSEPSIQQEYQAFRILLNARWYQWIKKARIRWLLRTEPRSVWLPFYEFLYQKCTRTVFVSEIKANGKTYYAPNNRLNNLSAVEFAVANDLHVVWRSKQSTEALLLLFHVLYSESKKRAPFDKLALDKKTAEKIPLPILLATEATFLGSLNHMSSKFPKVFPASQKNKQSKHVSFEKIILAMAKGDLSKLSTIENVNIYKFLEQFQDDIKEANERKRQQR
ncbi:hypothetical protein V3Q77_08235 [Flavobacterium davisii]|uniref:Uncharacterized protein n=2 Tax=Flavobacterium davisii TaxID=2906077 RepID=A0ABW8PPH5_9FLAO